MAAHATPTLVFLVSNGCSGSSLVHEVLARHPDVGFISNVEDRLPRLPARRHNNSLYRRVPQSLTRKGRLRYAPSEAYRLLAHEVSPAVVASSRDLVAADAQPVLAERFRRFVLERARRQGKPTFLHKFTGWPRSGFIAAVFPNARFIHILRDGRDVVSCTLRASWWKGWLGPAHMSTGPLLPAYAEEWESSGRSFVVLAALEWKTAMDAFAAARDLVPAERWLDVRYEDILADPRSRFKEMLSFAGLDPDERFDAALSRTAFRTDRQGVFRRDFDAATVALVERSLAEHLRHWGYR
ncbi:MAG: hypothetical protein GEV03_25330 [Streptosporangiales bacterium]|nr:hypothetical protein [Streptosporangiales bacterium]